LVLGIGIASGQYYWVLDIGWLSWYRSNPTQLRWFYRQSNHYYAHSESYLHVVEDEKERIGVELIEEFW